MTPREVRKARELRADVGLTERPQIDSSLIDRLEGDGIRLEQQKRGVADEFKATYANWHAEPGAPDMLPHALTEDTAIARNYRVAAVVALVAEMGVAAWMFWKRDMNPVFGALFALAITLIFERSIHFAVYGPTGKRRPKIALRRLKRVAFYPALGCFFFAVVTTLVARSIEGPLAADERILAVVTSGLFFLTVGLVFLAAALSTAAFIYRWSARLAGRYYALDAEWRASRAFMAEVRRDMATRPTTPVAPVTEIPSDDSVQSRSSVASMPRSIPTSVAGALIVSLLALGGTACTGHAAPADVQVAVVSQEALPDCNTIIDTSGSVANLGLVWSQVRRGLPDLVIRRHCAVLRVFTFDVDGWNWKPVVEIAIPATRPVDAVYVPAELDGAKNFKDAIEAKQRGAAAAARRAHEELVISLLRKLDVVDDFLKSVTSTPGSDPVGVLRRIARTPKSDDVFVVVTDMADTGSGSHHSAITAPSGAHVLVLLAPANRQDASYIGAPLAAADQYENRLRLLRTIAPWASVEPYFAVGYADRLSQDAAPQSGAK